MPKKKQVIREAGSSTNMDLTSQKMDIKSMMRDIEILGSSYMTWKEKKELENKKVVSLGGKPTKNQRLPLSVARATMKKQKEREQKLLQESLILGRFGGKLNSGTKKAAEKRNPEGRVLRSTEGHLKNGVLDVKHLFKPVASRDPGNSTRTFSEGKRKKGGKKNGGKKGGGRKRH